MDDVQTLASVSQHVFSTRGATTRHFQALIEATPTEGRAVFAAIQPGFADFGP